MVNRSVAWADWDEDLLRVELLELKGLDFDLTLTGFDLGEVNDYLAAEPLVKGLTDEDAAPAVAEQATTAIRDLWVLGNHRLLCGDATNGEDVARLMAADSADLVF